MARSEKQQAAAEVVDNPYRGKMPNEAKTHMENAAGGFPPAAQEAVSELAAYAAALERRIAALELNIK